MTDIVPTSEGELRITPMHDEEVLFEFGGKAYYVDVFDSSYCEGLPQADVIFITHERDAPWVFERIAKPSTTFVLAPGMPQHGSKLDGGVFLSAKHIVMRPGDDRQIEGVGALAIPAYEWTSVGQDVPPRRGKGNAFVLTFGDKRVYLAGTSVCSPEVRALKGIDIGFMSMGPSTLTPSSAGECIRAFAPKIVYPYGYRSYDTKSADSDASAEFVELERAIAGGKRIEVRRRDWYR
jgi:L-ascorbate metabolism protein UlaG (beta-lactamase superfamily)